MYNIGRVVKIRTVRINYEAFPRNPVVETKSSWGVAGTTESTVPATFVTIETPLILPPTCTI